MNLGLYQLTACRLLGTECDEADYPLKTRDVSWNSSYPAQPPGVLPN